MYLQDIRLSMSVRFIKFTNLVVIHDSFNLEIKEQQMWAKYTLDYLFEKAIPFA